MAFSKGDSVQITVMGDTRNGVVIKDNGAKVRVEVNIRPGQVGGTLDMDILREDVVKL